MNNVLNTIGSSELNRKFIDYYGRTRSQKRAFVYLATELTRMGKENHELLEKVKFLGEQQSQLLSIVQELATKISTLEKGSSSVVQPKRKPGRPRKET